MNIFIDSNILYKDYFFENKFNKKLLNIAKEKDINIHLSIVVIKELRRQYGNLLSEKNKVVKELLEDNLKLKIEFANLQEVNIEDKLNSFDKFYDQLENDEIITILDFDNDFLPKLVDRAVSRKMPFREDKSEFKDAVIWLRV